MSTKLSPTSILISVSLFASPFVLLAGAGALEGRAIAVAALLGAFVVALAVYLASAVSLVQREPRMQRQTLGARAALGGC